MDLDFGFYILRIIAAEPPSLPPQKIYIRFRGGGWGREAFAGRQIDR